MAFLSSVSPFLAVCRAVLIYFVLFSGLFLELSVFIRSVDFNYSEGSFFFFFFFKFSGIFHASSTVIFFFLVLVLFFLAGLHCLLRMHALSSCVGDT